MTIETIETSSGLLDALKEKTGARSDYALAKDVLMITPESLYQMRSRGLSDDRAVQIAEILGLDPGTVLASVHAERAKSPAVRKAWENLAQSLRSAAITAVLACTVIGSVLHSHSMVIMSNRRTGHPGRRATGPRGSRDRRTGARAAVVVACLLASTPGAADPARASANTLVLHVASRHLDTADQYRESNPGVGVRHSLGRGFLMGGGYINSLDRTTVYAGGGGTLASVGPVSLGVIAGLATGYSARIKPVLLPELSLRAGRVAVLVAYIPRIRSRAVTADAAVTLSVGINF